MDPLYAKRPDDGIDVLPVKIQYHPIPPRPPYPQHSPSPSPPPGPLYARYWNVHGVCHGWRPEGTRDWLFLYTQRGHMLVKYGTGGTRGDAVREFHGGPGDIILYRPGAGQDYGQHDRNKKWLHVWVHWVPRPEVIEWLDWPLLAPGIHHLHVPTDRRAALLRELVLVDASVRSSRHPHREHVAQNAMERALLMCADFNPARAALLDPTSAATPSILHHPRIEKAARALSADLTQCPALEDIARQSGYSRSRFAALFTQQIGSTPRRYQELQRLTRARDLLLYTGQNVQQIAEQLGFSTPFYFSLRFKQHFGQSPRPFRQQARAGLAPSW
ncbi:MAG: helix-turn-helix domain-containing protein [Candidatus Methylacidiphilales bacterium]|nr:helix-turn-helix domain-containing protein [Candidatus Methylacidiphilales bacterium]